MALSPEEKRYMVAIGKRIVALRKEKKIKQYELAIDLNVPAPSLRLIEKGKTNPTTKSLLRIAKALDVSVKDLFENTEF